MSSKTPSSKDNLKIKSMKSKLRFGSQMAIEAIHKFKADKNQKNMLKGFSTAFADDRFRSYVMPNPFPVSPADLLKPNPLAIPHDYLNEIFWASAICLQYISEIREFISIKSELESAVLLGNNEVARSKITSVKNKFGFSIWYIQNDLIQTQAESGLEAQRQKALQYLSTIGPGEISTFLVKFISIRSEGSSLKDRLKQSLDEFLDSYQDNANFVAYFSSKITDIPHIVIREFPGILHYEATSSLIDLYESLIIILQTIAANSKAPTEVRENLIYVASELDGKIGDTRLRNILRGFGAAVPVNAKEICKRRGDIINEYTIGNYENTVKLATELLAENPNDPSIISLSAKASARINNSDEAENNLLGEIITALTKINRSDQDAFYAAYTLMTLTAKYYSHSWAPQIKLAVQSMLSTPTTDFPGDIERKIFILADLPTPFAALAFRGQAQSLFLLELEKNYIAYETIKILKAILTPAREDYFNDENITIRVKKLLARKSIAIENIEVAISQLTDIKNCDDQIDRREILSLLLLCATKIKDTKSAIISAVDISIENSISVSKIPLEEIMALIEDPQSWPLLIELPIFLELYSSVFSREKQQHLCYSFEKFQLENNFESPTELAAQLEIFGKEKVIAYLDKVCVPDVMRQTLLYDGTKQVEDERIRICRALIEIDPLSAPRYLDELRQRVKVLEIKAGLSIVEQSMVYVDINAITKSLKSRIKDSYAQYKAVTEMRRPDISLQVLAEAIQLISTGSSSRNVKILNLERNEENSVFAVMFMEVINEFLKSEHGLNAFLSTRIRHGKLRNLLRKSVEEENLVTARREASNLYQVNTFWTEKLEVSGGSEEDVVNVLSQFAEAYDKKISYILDTLLQVHIIDGTSDIKDNKAWFVYRTSYLEMITIRSDENSEDTVEDFIDRCVDLLWQKTDSNLVKIKSDLTGYIRNDFMALFDELSRDIMGIQREFHAQPLLDAVARARNNTQNKLQTAVHWFNRSAVYDRPDYSLDMPMNVAIAIINNIRSGLHDDFKNYVTPEIVGAEKLPGRTLDGLVDMFGILFENAIDHCGLDINKLEVSVSLKFEERRITISMTNNLVHGTIAEESKSALQSIRDGIGKDGAKKYLQNEGRSGFHKIWKIISAPIYHDALMAFDYTKDDTFAVSVSAFVER